MKLNNQSEKYSENINQSDILQKIYVQKIVVVLICKHGFRQL